MFTRLGNSNIQQVLFTVLEHLLRRQALLLLCLPLVYFFLLLVEDLLQIFRSKLTDTVRVLVIQKVSLVFVEALIPIFTLRYQVFPGVHSLLTPRLGGIKLLPTARQVCGETRAFSPLQEASCWGTASQPSDSSFFVPDRSISLFTPSETAQRTSSCSRGHRLPQTVHVHQ